MSDERMDRMRSAFSMGNPPETEINPLIPRFALIDEASGQLITRFALDREYRPGEEIVLPSIRVRMP